MERQMSNYERENTERRAQMLRERIKLDIGPEQETARRLLAKIEKKLAYDGKLSNSLETEITDDIFKLENVILTPHIGSNTEECMERIAMDVARDVHLVLSGEDPRHPIRQ